MTGNSSMARFGRIALILMTTTAISGCASTPLGQAINNVMSGSGGQATATAPEPPKDENGIIAYNDFRVMVANDGDTIASMAGRVGLTEVVLARYNGLPANYLLREGDRLALPDDAQVAAVEQGWTPEVVTGVLDDLPDAPANDTVIAEPPGDLPLRHRVEPGETLFSIAKLYGVSVTALASWNGIGGDLKVADGRSLIIPNNPAIAAAAPAVTTTDVEDVAISEPGEGTKPRSCGDPRRP